MITQTTPDTSNGNNPHPSRNWVTAISFLTILVFFLILNAKMISPFILSLLMGGILAILFSPYYEKLIARNIKPIWASGIVTITVLLIIVIPLTSFIMLASQQASTIAQELSQKENISLDSIIHKASDLKFMHYFIEDEQQLKEKFTQSIQEVTSKTAQSLLSVVGSLPDRLLQMFLAILSCFFLLMDGKKFVIFLNDKIPLDGDVRIKLYGSFQNTAISVIWATVAASASQAIVMFFAFLILGVPGAFLAGIATFIFAWFPFVGSFPVWGAGAVYLLTKDRNISLSLMIVFGIIASTIDNYVRPLILKGRNELHPLIGIVSIFGGIAMFGLVGVFFGPVFAATLISLLQIWPTVGKRFGLIFDPPIDLLFNKRKTDI